MSRYLLYVSDQEGAVQARLALHLLRQANSTHQWTLQHGGMVNEEQLTAFDDVLVLGEGEFSPALKTYPKQDIHYAVINPLVTIATLKHQPNEDILSPPSSPQTPVVEKPAEVATGIKIVGVTSCPAGIAYTFMAAEGLQVGAESLGFDVKIETQGNIGIDNELTPEDIAAADVVIVAADTKVDLERFTGKRLYQTSTKSVTQNGSGIIQLALAQATVYEGKNAKKAEDEDSCNKTMIWLIVVGAAFALGLYFGSHPL